jgi:hypothetical protein
MAIIIMAIENIIVIIQQINKVTTAEESSL